MFMPNGFYEDSSLTNAMAKTNFFIIRKTSLYLKRLFPSKISPFVEKEYQEVQKLTQKLI